VTSRGDAKLLDFGLAKRLRLQTVDWRARTCQRFRTTAKGGALPLQEAVALVERVQVSAERHAKLGKVLLC
jgi:hypothetical protein